MYDDLKIAYYQRDIVFGDKQKNYEAIEQEMANHKDEGVNLLVLPELFATGLKNKNNIDFAEKERGETYHWMQNLARQYDMVVMGSMVEKDVKDNIFNTLYMVYPNGDFGVYKKRHLFGLGSERKEMSQGIYNIPFSVKGWRIASYICYDLRFPSWMRNDFYYPRKFKYDVCVVVANWPACRNDAWKKLLEARAIENMAYVVGCNRIGKDNNGVEYSGESRVINYKGEVIDTIESNKSKLQIVSLNYRELRHFREDYPFYMDWDNIGFKAEDLTL